MGLGRNLPESARLSLDQAKGASDILVGVIHRQAERTRQPKTLPIDAHYSRVAERGHNNARVIAYLEGVRFVSIDADHGLQRRLG